MEPNLMHYSFCCKIGGAMPRFRDFDAKYSGAWALLRAMGLVHHLEVPRTGVYSLHMKGHKNR